MSYSICLGEGAVEAADVDFEFVAATPSGVLRTVMSPEEQTVVSAVVRRAMAALASDLSAG